MYEQSLLASRRRSKTRLVFLPVALAIHVFALAGVAIAQYWTVEPVAEPPIQVSFHLEAAPPPPPPAGPPPAPEPAHAGPQQVVEIATEPVQPIAIPEHISEAPDRPEISSVPGGVPDGVPNGVPDGVRDGVPGGSRLGVPGGTTGSDGLLGGSTIHHVEGDVEKPEILERVQPVYTESARRARIQGIVIVETIIDTQGRVTDVRVLKALPMGLTESAVDAVKRWRFRPATLDRRPVSVYFTLTVKFELQ